MHLVPADIDVPFFKARTDFARMGFAFYGPFAFVIGATHTSSPTSDSSDCRCCCQVSPRRPHTAADLGPGPHGLLTNIAITTVGNLIGGTLFVALPFELVTKLQEKGR